jgi:hypothetical protein
MDTQGNRVTVPLNDKLPIEILWKIFETYSVRDSIDNPLEKLLCICKSWSNAARRHQAIWSYFTICISEDRDIRFWSSRVTDRLAICGEDTLLDIEFECYLGPIGTNKNETKARILGISSSLIGRDGSFVKRWRRLCFRDLPFEIRTLWNGALALPTPNLRFLEISGLSFSQPILLRLLLKS